MDSFYSNCATKVLSVFTLLLCVSVEAEYTFSPYISVDTITTNLIRRTTVTNSASTPLVLTDLWSQSDASASYTMERQIVDNLVYIRSSANGSVTGFGTAVEGQALTLWTERAIVRWTNALPISGTQPTGGQFREVYAVIGSAQIPNHSVSHATVSYQDSSGPVTNMDFGPVDSADGNDLVGYSTNVNRVYIGNPVYFTFDQPVQLIQGLTVQASKDYADFPQWNGPGTVSVTMRLRFMGYADFRDQDGNPFPSQNAVVYSIDTGLNDPGYPFSQEDFTNVPTSFDPPTVSLFQTNGILQLCWPLNYLDFQLESSYDPASPNWVSVTNVPIIVGTNACVQLPLSQTNQFFRLKW